MKHTARPPAVLFAYGLPFYLVDLGKEWPVIAPRFMPAPFFEIVEPKIPSDWSWATYVLPDGERADYLWRSEFVQNEHLYDSMIEGEPSAVRLFEKWRSEASNE